MNATTVADGDDAREQMAATSGSRRRTGGETTMLSPDVLAVHNRSASVSVPPSNDRTAERCSSRVGARSRSRSYSRTPSPASRRDGGVGDLEENDGGERSRRGGGGGYRQQERNSMVNVSPVRSGDGSTSSQTRGFRRLTRRLSFHHRQAQANIQVHLLVKGYIIVIVGYDSLALTTHVMQNSCVLPKPLITWMLCRCGKSFRFSYSREWKIFPRPPYFRRFVLDCKGGAMP